MVENIWKDKLSSVIGALLMLLAIGCYYFDFPREANATHNLIEAGLGLILLFIDKKKIANTLFGRFKKEVE